LARAGSPLLFSVGGSEDEFTDRMFGDDPASRGHIAIIGRKRG